MKDIASSIGNAIKLCRTKRGLTQGELAERVGFSVSYLSLIEKGKRTPDLEVLNQTAQALNMPLNLLVFLATDKTELAELDRSVAEKLSYLVLELIENDDREAVIQP